MTAVVVPFPKTTLLKGDVPFPEQNPEVLIAYLPLRLSMAKLVLPFGVTMLVLRLRTPVRVADTVPIRATRLTPFARHTQASTVLMSALKLMKLSGVRPNLRLPLLYLRGVRLAMMVLTALLRKLVM